MGLSRTRSAMGSFWEPVPVKEGELEGWEEGKDGEAVSLEPLSLWLRSLYSCCAKGGQAVAV